MDDSQIVQLYWERSEEAIPATAKKYGSYCHSIANNILQNDQDAEECVNDTYFDAWNAMPPHKPSVLSTFLGKITRRISIDRWRTIHRSKRGSDQVILALEELAECTDPQSSVEQAVEAKALSACMDRFLATLPTAQRRIFLQRYWYLESIDRIAAMHGFSQGKVTSILHRLRGKLRIYLEEEGYL